MNYILKEVSEGGMCVSASEIACVQRSSKPVCHILLLIQILKWTFSLYYPHWPSLLIKFIKQQLISHPGTSFISLCPEKIFPPWTQTYKWNFTAQKSDSILISSAKPSITPRSRSLQVNLVSLIMVIKPDINSDTV